MNGIREELDALFSASGATVAKSISCDALYLRRDTVVGLVISPTPKTAYARWAAAQAELETLRAKPEYRFRDFFLAFLVESLAGEGLIELERLLDDPYVCRKLLVDLSGDVRDAVEGAGLITDTRAPAPVDRDFSIEVVGLDEKIVERLAKKSARAIADELADDRTSEDDES